MPLPVNNMHMQSIVHCLLYIAYHTLHVYVKILPALTVMLIVFE